MFKLLLCAGTLGAVSCGPAYDVEVTRTRADVGEGEGAGEGEGETPHMPARYRSLHAPMTQFVVDRLRTVRAGQTNKRDAVFAKVGDSMTVSTNYLQCFASDAVELGTLDVDETRLFFASDIDSYRRVSAAATVGWSSSAAIAGQPSPLDVEIDTIQPRFAVVQFGTNDVGFRTITAFANDMTTIVDGLLGRGVIPVVVTMPPRDDDSEADARVPRFNLAVRAVAEARQIPFVDIESALRVLPGHGTGPDGIHLEGDGRGACMLDSEGLLHGDNVRNAVVLEALDRAKRAAVDGVVLDEDIGPPRRGAGSPADPIIIDALPYTDARDTSTSVVRTQDVWTSCSAADESGPELFFRLTLAVATRVRIIVIDGSGIDVDVHHVVDDSCVARNDVELVIDADAGATDIAIDTYGGDNNAGAFLILALAE
jgi:GDSL-like Lipase/Acylhydrolase family